MAALIGVDDVNAWLDTVKASISSVEGALADQVTAQVLGSIGKKYTTETWSLPQTTPLLVRRVISMFYAGFYYLKIYSTDSESSDYGELLLQNAQILLDNIVNGNIVIAGDLLVSVARVDPGSLIAVELTLTEPKFSMDAEW